MGFPFLFGGTFIEASIENSHAREKTTGFPFLFGGTFIEARSAARIPGSGRLFPFLFGGAFIEAL